MEPPRLLMPRRARWTSSLWTCPSFSTCPTPGAHDWTGMCPLPPSFNQGPFLSVYGCCVVYIERTRDVNLDTPKDISNHFCDVWYSQKQNSVPHWHGRLNCFLNLTLVLHLNQRDNRVYLKSWKPISAGDEGKPSFLLIGWHLFKELCNLVASMDIWLGNCFSFALDPLLKVTGCAQRKHCAMVQTSLFRVFTISIFLSLSFSGSQSLILRFPICSVALLNLGPYWVSLGDEMVPKQECNISKYWWWKRNKNIFQCSPHFHAFFIVRFTVNV